jgi:hypothetical protein
MVAIGSLFIIFIAVFGILAVLMLIAFLAKLTFRLVFLPFALAAGVLKLAAGAICAIAILGGLVIAAPLVLAGGIVLLPLLALAGLVKLITLL